MCWYPDFLFVGSFRDADTSNASLLPHESPCGQWPRGVTCGICDLNACLWLMRPAEYRTLPIPFAPAAILQYPQALTSLARVVRCFLFPSGYQEAWRGWIRTSNLKTFWGLMLCLGCLNPLSYTPCRFCRDRRNSVTTHLSGSESARCCGWHMKKARTRCSSLF